MGFLLVSGFLCHRLAFTQSEKTTPRTDGIVRHAWLSSLPDERNVSELFLPGTHNSVSRFFGPARTQSWTLSEQLNNGIRFLDVRVSYAKDKLQTCHGDIVYTYSFENCLDECTEFLKRNPSEIIIMLIANEGRAKDAAQRKREGYDSIIEHLNREKYLPFIFADKDRIPMLGELRGKILPIHRHQTIFEFDGDATVRNKNLRDVPPDNPRVKALPYTGLSAHNFSAPHRGWMDNRDEIVSVNRFLLIEDWYHNNDHTKKVELVKKMLMHDELGESSDRLKLCFSSGYSFPGFAGSYAKKITPLLRSFLDESHRESRELQGILIMDYPPQDIVDKIIDINLKDFPGLSTTLTPSAP